MINEAACGYDYPSNGDSENGAGEFTLSRASIEDVCTLTHHDDVCYNRTHEEEAPPAQTGREENSFGVMTSLLADFCRGVSYLPHLPIVNEPSSRAMTKIASQSLQCKVDARHAFKRLYW